jgi:CRP-like cAMP-binding protein
MDLRGEKKHQACLPFLDAGELETVLGEMETVSVEKGKYLFNSGDAAGGVYFLFEGRLAVQKFTGFGDRTQVVGLLDPGAPVGEAGVLEGQQRDAAVLAIKDAELLFLSNSAYGHLADREPRIAIKLLQWLLGRTSLRLKKSSERLAHVL